MLRWPTHYVSPWPAVHVGVVLAAVMYFSEVMDKLGHACCLTHVIASVVLVSHGGDSSRDRTALASFWCSQSCSVAASSLTLSMQSIKRLKKQLTWKKAHKKSNLLPTRKGKYACEICLESWVSGLNELLPMSQNQPLFLAVSKDLILVDIKTELLCHLKWWSA